MRDGFQNQRKVRDCSSASLSLASCKARATLFSSLTLRDFVAALRHPFPPAAGRCKAQIKNGDQVNLSPFSCALRRERDSNPRTREDQQFSRLPHSTTLPSLQYVFPNGNAKVLINFNPANFYWTFFSFLSEFAKNLYWKSNKYTAPQLTQASAKLKIPPNIVPGWSIHGSWYGI